MTNPDVAPVSADVPDWSRERPRRLWDPSRRLIHAVRGWQASARRAGVLGALVRRRWVLSHHFWSIVTGADLPLKTEIGGGLLMPHPNGVVVHPLSKIGPNCLLMQQTTLGVGRSGVPPTLGGNVDVGAGAKIIGAVHVGDHAIIGANAVVVRDVPAGSVVVGVPARRIDMPPDPAQSGAQ